MTANWQLAQINVARLQYAEGDERVAEFFDNLDRINALAEASDGFIWRLKEEGGGNATGIAATPDPRMIVNMSVWRDADALFAFTYRSAHTPVMAKRREWFERPDGAYQALWWIEAGRHPTVEEGLSKLWLIDRFGPSPQAFGFKSRFPAPDHAGPPVDHKPDPWCVGHA
ncbi:DUF3291 domain-containing protein [Altererythrobacter sp.]|uniref:DUF3291 domain-containing protein n=1 Tax=Altererythrobacter sp. TaxID=1872480 RepID=UPI003D05D3F4